VRVEINSVGNPSCRAVYRDKLREFFAPVKEKLCKDCQSRYDRNPMRILDCKVDQKHGEGAPSILDYLDEECSVHFAKVQRYLSEMGIEYSVNPRMVRGLDYYTHTAFEYKAAGIGAIDTISGGGRYNGLVGTIGGEALDRAGVGFGLGLERVLLVLEAQGVEVPSIQPIDIYLIGLGEAAEDVVTRLLFELRAAGLTAEKDYLGRKVKAQMKAADRHEARLTAILGEDELNRGTITLKHMASGEQEEIALNELVQAVRDKLVRKE
jgi:histidyl-tRNA synthetase